MISAKSPYRSAPNLSGAACRATRRTHQRLAGPDRHAEGVEVVGGIQPGLVAARDFVEGKAACRQAAPRAEGQRRAAGGGLLKRNPPYDSGLVAYGEGEPTHMA